MDVEDKPGEPAPPIPPPADSGTPPTPPPEPTPAPVPEQKQEEPQEKPVEVDAMKAEYETKIAALEEQLKTVVAEKAAVERQEGIRQECAKAGMPELAKAFEGVTEITGDFVAKIAKVLTDMKAAEAATAAAITPDGEKTDTLSDEDAPLSQLTNAQIREKLKTKK